jgi:hypothetical protein
MDRFLVNSTAYITVVAYDENGERTSGLHILADVLKPDGTKVQNLALEELAFEAGVYYLAFTETVQTGYYIFRVFDEDYQYVDDIGYFLVVSAGALGAYVLNVNVVDEQGVPLQGCFLGLYDSSGLLLLAIRITGADGHAVFPIPEAGRYILRCWKVGYFFEDVVLNIMGDTSVVLTGHKVEIGYPQDARLIRVYGFLGDLGLSIDRVRKTDIVFILLEAPRFIDSELLLLFPVKAKVDKRTGFFYADVVRGVWVNVVCDAAGLYRKIFIPQEGLTVALKDLVK